MNSSAPQPFRMLGWTGMTQGGRYARRLAIAIAAFELLAGFGNGSLAASGLWRTIFVIAAPFAIYGLLLPLGARLFEKPAARIGGGVLFALIVAQYFLRHHRSAPFSLDAAATLGAAALGGVLLLVRPLRADAWSRWLLPAAAVPAALALVLWLRAEGAPWRGLPPAAPPRAGAPNLVLVSWDTVRADVLDLYGGAGVSTPHLDRLAAEGVVFDDAVASASITGPSHATMLTGHTPPLHGLRSNGAEGIAASVPTLAELLVAAGYRTGGFVAAYPLLGKFGFARGFELYDDRLPASGAVQLAKLGRRNFLWLQAASLVLPKAPDAAVPGVTVNRRAADWLDGLAHAPDPRPFFLFVHYYDAHGPFTPPAEWRAAATAAAPGARPLAVDPAVADEMTLYRAEIAQVDALFGSLRERLEELDPGLQNTLILITADHGECFGEGGIVLNHTASLHEATQHVPLVLRLPAAASAGTRVAATATHLDVAPTFLAAAQHAPVAAFAGTGLRLTDLAAEPAAAAPSRPVYVEAQQLHLAAERKIGWRADRRKVVRWHDGREELWGFRPGEVEGVDLRAAEPDAFTRLRAALDEFLDSIEPVLGTAVELGAADAAALGALGYTGD